MNAIDELREGLTEAARQGITQGYLAVPIDSARWLLEHVESMERALAAGRTEAPVLASTGARLQLVPVQLSRPEMCTRCGVCEISVQRMRLCLSCFMETQRPVPCGFDPEAGVSYNGRKPDPDGAA